jgi:hypothetical protein
VQSVRACRRSRPTTSTGRSERGARSHKLTGVPALPNPCPGAALGNVVRSPRQRRSGSEARPDHGGTSLRADGLRPRALAGLLPRPRLRARLGPRGRGRLRRGDHGHHRRAHPARAPVRLRAQPRVARVQAAPGCQARSRAPRRWRRAHLSPDGRPRRRGRATAHAWSRVPLARARDDDERPEPWRPGDLCGRPRRECARDRPAGTALGPRGVAVETGLGGRTALVTGADRAAFVRSTAPHIDYPLWDTGG